MGEIVFSQCCFWGKDKFILAVNDVTSGFKLQYLLKYKDLKYIHENLYNCIPYYNSHMVLKFSMKVVFQLFRNKCHKKDDTIRIRVDYKDTFCVTSTLV